MSRLRWLLLTLLLAACAPTGTEEGGGVKRYVDPDTGIVCFWRYDGGSSLSCVQPR